MSSGFTVDRQELLESVAALQKLEASLTEAMESADREVNRLHAQWSGAAAAEHRDAHQRWRTATAEMHAALVVMRRVAHGAHGNYTAAVTANTSMWAV